ncbi:MAG: amidohydrolase [Proteobacteria bacterium]|nr:amidohydrolase [Pseudomonadota bacterium]MDA0994983.1 amidohydrolase [Pseudomonadota bacterium]
MKNVFVILATCLILFACEKEQGDSRTRVDTILHNGKVVTIDASLSIMSAVVVDGDSIVAVGGDELLEEYVANNTVDLAGKVLMPGFVDSHTHIRGEPQRHINLTETKSIEEIKNLVSDKAAELGEGEWITGYGWSEDFMAELRRPLRTDLDEAAPDNPVLLTRAGGHSAVANSAALRQAEITATTPQPDNGVIEHRDDGELNGVIRERQDIISRLIPEATNEEVRDSLIAELRRQLSLGITSLTHATGSIEAWPEWETIYSQHRGTLPRANLQVFWIDPGTMMAFGKKSGDGDEHLRVGPIKIFVDGGFTGPAAYTKEPYKDQPDYRGTLSIEPAELTRIISELNAAGWQTGIHAIGDAAIELVVDELALALDENPRVDHRHYLNHFTVMPSSVAMAKMAEYGIAVTQQANFTYTLEGRYVDYLDGDRVEHNNPLRTPMNHGIHVALSSDILPIGPMVGIYAAVTRKGMSGRVFAAEEALSVMEALQAYTLYGAWLSFEEGMKGSIEAGKLADMIVLDQDILTIDPAQILNVNIEQTWLGGRLVYERSE